MRTAEVSDVKERSKDSGTRQKPTGREYPPMNSYARAGEPFRCDFEWTSEGGNEARDDRARYDEGS